MKKMLQIALIAAAAAAAFGASAQEFPAKDKTVTIVVPFAAGGPTDRVARDLAEQVGSLLARQRLGAARAASDFFDVLANAHFFVGGMGETGLYSSVVLHAIDTARIYLNRSR